MRYDFIVLGATGMQGRIVTKDIITRGYTVLMCGRDKSRIEDFLRKYKNKTSFTYLDIKDKNKTIKTIKESGAKVVVNCIEGNWNLIALKYFIEAGISSIDLGSDISMTREQLGLNRVLKRKGLIHITGCGSVPGIGNVMLHYAAEKFKTIGTVEVGFAWDSNIKKFVVPFSIQSIMQEFTSPAPYLQNNKYVTVKPMDSIVRANFRAIGNENEFKCGHHPETYTFYRYCKKKGLKNLKFWAGFPEHSMNKILTMIELGFKSKKPINFNGVNVEPDKFLTEVLKRIEMPKGYTETENLWVLVKNRDKKILMECIVPPLKGWEDAGCNIDTGMPASIMAQMVFKKEINQPGSYAPEDIVPIEPFFNELRKRKMLVYENGKIIN